MGAQDGVDLAVRAADHSSTSSAGPTSASPSSVPASRSTSCGPCSTELGLDDFVEFTGRVPDDAVAGLLSTADVGLCPDPKNPLNDVSTMNKTMEYMAFGLPVVAFDLHETRVSAADAAVYAEPNEVQRLRPTSSSTSLDDEPRRPTMGRLRSPPGRRTAGVAAQRTNYLQVYEELTRAAPHFDGRHLARRTA